MTTVSQLAAALTAGRYCARTASYPAQLDPLASAYGAHASWISNGKVLGCAHAGEPPYIVIADWEDRAWCTACVRTALDDPPPYCRTVEHGVTRIYMFPFGDILVAGYICPECGGAPATSDLR